VTAGAALMAYGAIVGGSFAGGLAGAIGSVGLAAGWGTGWAVAAGAGFGFGSAFATSLLNGGSIGDAFKSGITGAIGGAITGGVAGQFVNTYTIGRVAATATANGVSEEISGGSFRHGFTTAAVMGTLDLINIKAREATAKSSRLYVNDNGVQDNATGISGGMHKDGDKWGGTRMSMKITAIIKDRILEPIRGALGGFQGGTGKISGLGDYPAFSIRDSIVEYFSGMHDLLGSPTSYDAQGNNVEWESPVGKHVSSLFGGGTLGMHAARAFSNIHALIDIPLAAPFAAGSAYVDYQPYIPVRNK